MEWMSLVIQWRKRRDFRKIFYTPKFLCVGFMCADTEQRDWKNNPGYAAVKERLYSLDIDPLAVS